MLEGIVSVGTVGMRRVSKVFGVGNGAGSGSRLLRLENGKMGPDVVPEDPRRLEKEKAFGKKFMNRAIGRIRRCRIAERKSGDSEHGSTDETIKEIGR